jgi:hypothetical protein
MTDDWEAVDVDRGVPTEHGGATAPMAPTVPMAPMAPMAPMESADHAMGLELQIVELVEQQTRARVQHRDGDAELFEGELAELRTELAATADPAFPASASPVAPS